MRSLVLSPLLLASLVFLVSSPLRAQDDPPQATPPSLPPIQYGDDLAPAFVPEHPLDESDRTRIETYTDYAAARALENRREWAEAIARLEKALGRTPDSLPVLRRLARLCFILGRTEKALGYAEKVLDADPGDTETLSLLVSHYDRTNDPAAAEALLRKLADNPKLVKDSPGYLLIQRDLGFLYADRLDQPAKAADAFRNVLDALDNKAANKLSLADQRRLLGFDEAASYGRFGEVFLDTDRFDDAITAFRRGLVYDPDNAILPRLLAQAFLRKGDAEAALSSLEPFLKRQPQGNEPYDLLIEILEKLKRPDEILPRLEAAARNDPKNLPLQYLLADRYRQSGQPEKANELYRTLLATQPDPQGFGALAASLVREKKTEELIDLLGKAFAKPETLEAVKPQIEAITNDPDFTDTLLEAGLEMQQAEPPRLSRESRLILSYIANRAEKLDKLIPIQRIALKRDPNPQAYREFWLDLYRARKYEEAASVLEEMFEQFPDQRDAQTLTALAQSQAFGTQPEAALATCDEVLKLDARSIDGLRLKGYLLTKLARNEQAIALYEDMLEQFPDNEEVVRLARSGLSVVYVNMNQLDKGEAELEILFERDPDDAGVNNDLGYLYADQGKNLEKAETMIRKALDEDPENSAYLDSLGWALYRQGKLEEAFDYIDKAVTIASEAGLEDPTLLDHLGDVSFKLNKFDRAREAWTKAETMAAAAQPPDRRLPEIRKKLESLKELAPAAGPDSPNP